MRIIRSSYVMDVMWQCIRHAMELRRYQKGNGTVAHVKQGYGHPLLWLQKQLPLHPLQKLHLLLEGKPGHRLQRLLLQRVRPLHLQPLQLLRRQPLLMGNLHVSFAHV